MRALTPDAAFDAAQSVYYRMQPGERRGREILLTGAELVELFTLLSQHYASPSASAQPVEPDGIACSSCGLTMQQSRWLAAAPAPSASPDALVEYAETFKDGLERGIAIGETRAASASPAADQAADRQWRTGFLAGWNAGIEGDEAKLRAAQNRVGKLADYEASASPAALTDEREVFEAWAKKHPDTDGVGAPFECESDGSYEWKWIQGMWEAWQGRALLAASPADQGEDARDE